MFEVGVTGGPAFLWPALRSHAATLVMYTRATNPANPYIRSVNPKEA